jgi:2,4-dienoyl-CoA reductase-like NADH-dependent reductase (Old Yellow Enzyme family)
MESIKKDIFDSSLVQGHKLRNRLIVAPMTRKSATPDGIPTTQMAAYYTAFARGGFSMIITEGIYTDNYYSKADNNQPGLTNNQQADGWAQAVKGIHQYNALAIAQLMHGGATGQYSEHTIAPSAVRPVGVRETEAGGLTGRFPIPKEMTLTDMENVKDGYVNAALLAHHAGFDGVELHAANGYLFDQFITPHTNLRTDEYGGSIINRLRFLTEVFIAVKQALPADFIIGVRLSESKVNDLSYRWPNGAEMATEIFTVLKELDVAYFHLAAEGGNWARECSYPDGSSSSEIARAITNKPVIANGGLHDLEIARSLLDNGQTDLLSIGRAAIASPDWPNLIAAGKQPVAFFKALIKPSLTLQHAEAVLKGNICA